MVFEGNRIIDKTPDTEMLSGCWLVSKENLWKPQEWEHLWRLGRNSWRIRPPTPGSLTVSKHLSSVSFSESWRLSSGTSWHIGKYPNALLFTVRMCIFTQIYFFGSFSIQTIQLQVQDPPGPCLKSSWRSVTDTHWSNSQISKPWVMICTCMVGKGGGESILQMPLLSLQKSSASK